MNRHIFENIDSNFLQKALNWADRFPHVCLFQSNGYGDEHSAFEWLLAVDKSDEFVSDGTDTLNKLERFKAGYPNRWILGFFGYDLKNEIEDLTTSSEDHTAFPSTYFFVPRTVMCFRNGRLEVVSEDISTALVESIQAFKTSQSNRAEMPFSITFRKRMSKLAYIEAFEQLKSHIARGDIYEANLCQEFYAERCTIDPQAVYRRLREVSPSPFAAFFRLNDLYILSASPERFLAKRGDTLISQPIKGTAPRGRTLDEDMKIKTRLLTDPKEIAENVMIVDLVRNDLTRCAKPGSVSAEKRLELHSFRQVHQLISTVTCQKDEMLSDLACIRSAFPPGSMTGAPKISAMQLCDRHEKSKRGVYSGALGYFGPNGDFDFNVVIRTLLYNETRKYLSFHTGGAITFAADAEEEYRECLVKARGLLETLNGSLAD